ncbi:hypothetical protein DFQ04_0165 [Algoriphagus boseongensis]|uniref:Uncharacterized protein n=1 Tax=Algoriphagus boseongensis TaxID=1442587 RepID=A0A4R6T6W7_9BACT|nr:hypothetical protein [Algoriphagus boseongensis]TDQ18366.1 hypothetical protein DFQ04_0165 [Algoriphagus boseongensis]
MKNWFILAAIGLLLFGCNPTNEEKAHDLLKKSIEAHGGEDAWDQLAVIQFTKWTKLLDENGNVESELNQWHEFRFKPYFEGKISWAKDSIDHVVSFDGAEISYFLGGNEVKNRDFLAAKKKDFDAAFYTLAQPWKLLDGGGKLSYEGRKTLENNQEVESIRVDYGPDKDIWWYHFDSQSHLMVASEVQLKDHRSLVYDLEEENIEGLKLHGRRESWRINEKGERLFLRAEYLYSDYKITFKN